MFDPDIDVRPGAFRPWELRSRVHTQSDLVNLPNWEAAGIIRDSGGTLAGGSGSAGGLPSTIGGAPSTLNITASTSVFYKIEVVDATNAVVIASVPFLANNQGLEIEVNRASTLRFRVAGTYASIASIALPNQVVLRDRWGFVIGRFVIQKRIPVREGGAVFYDFVCQDILAQLSRDPVPYYETTIKTVRGIVEDLMALQVQGTTIGIGIIDESIAVQEIAFYAQDTSVLGAIIQLRESLPKETAGYLYVDNNRMLCWRRAIGLDGTINSAAVTGLRYEVSHDEQVTRLYMYGEGQDPRTRLRLTDAGEAQEYIQDSTAVSTYGVLPAIKVEPSITDADTLLAVAQRVLAEYKDPHITVDINVLDLAKAQTDLYSEDDIYIGSLYTVTDSDLGISTSVRLRRISYNLSNPLPLSVELDNRRQRLDDFIAELIRKQNPPLNVNDDGTLYPNITRFYDDGGAQFPKGYRNGDLRYGVVDGEAYMFYRDSDDGGAGPYGNTPDDGPWTRLSRAADIRWAVIEVVYDDYLQCKFWTPQFAEAYGASFNVAKPFLLQRTPFDGEMISYIDGEQIYYTQDAVYTNHKRLHDNLEDSSNFVITPNYYEGEPILIVKTYTNVQVSGSFLTWIELGMGRYWARVDS